MNKSTTYGDSWGVIYQMVHMMYHLKLKTYSYDHNCGTYTNRWRT